VSGKGDLEAVGERPERRVREQPERPVREPRARSGERGAHFGKVPREPLERKHRVRVEEWEREAAPPPSEGDDASAQRDRARR